MDTRVRLEKIPYHTPQTAEAKANIARTANMTNEELLNASANKTLDDSSKTVTAKLSKAIFPTTIGALILNEMAQAKIKSGKNAPPSIKLAVGLSSLASWLIFAKSLDVAGDASKKVADKTENPDLKTGINVLGAIGGGIGLYLGVITGINKLLSKFVKKMPDTTKEIAKKARSFDEKFLSNNIVKSLKKHVSDPLKNIAKKHPKTSGFISKNASLLILGGSIISAIALAFKKEKDKQELFDKNLQDMLQTREEAKKALNMLDKAEINYDKIFEKPRYADTENIINAAAEPYKDIDKVTQKELNKALAD